MASDVDICNRALQKLGASRITTLTEDSRNARSCNVAYTPVLEAMLRKHAWNCGIKRASIAADATAPTWGKANSFTLPTDFLYLIDNYPEYSSNDLDYVIEGRSLVTDFDAPFQMRYIGKITDPNIMDSLFREAFATNLALELCEEITQSNTKKDSLKDDLREIMKEARKANAFEKIPSSPVDPTWITVR